VAVAAVLLIGAVAGVVIRRVGRPHAGIGAPPAGPSGVVAEEAALRAAASQSPSSGAARQALGRYYLDRGRPFEAIWELWAAHHLQPADTSTTLQLAVALASGQLYDQAVEQLEALASQRPPTRDGRVQLATLYMARMQPQKAAAVLSAAPGLGQWAEGQLTLGKARETLGQVEAAKSAYRRAMALAPSSDEPPYRLGKLLLRQGDGPAARRVLQSARPDRPSARLLTLIAETHLTGVGKDTRFAAAEQVLRAAHEADPTYVPCLVALGRLAERQHRFSDGRAAYDEALRLDPGDPAANQGMADLLAAAGHPVEAHAARALSFRARALPNRAIQEYESLARSPAHEVDAVLELSLILVQTQQKLRAAQVIEAALAKHPLDTALYERDVVLQHGVRRFEQAQRRCEEWQGLEPASRRPLWLTGRIAADRGDLARGTHLLEQVVAAEPENMDYLATLGEVLLRDPTPAHLTRARELLERVVARTNAEPQTYYDLGQTLQRLGEHDAARWAFLRALDGDPKLSEPYVNLAQLARPLDQPEQLRLWGPIVRSVEEHLRTELLLSRRVWNLPSDADGYRALAQQYLEAVELSKAQSQLEEAVRLRPRWVEARQLLQQIRRTREVL
jgi:tetratricopeptide (TPR) repeat protein